MTQRSYDEGCIAAHALDLIGDRWSLLVVREMMLGPRRFGALRAGIPGISANVLTQKLADLVGAGLCAKVDLPAPAMVSIYQLTEAGLDLWPVLKALCLWGARQPGHDPSLFISPIALMLSMRATCNRSKADRHLVNFQIADEWFTVRTAPGEYQVQSGKDEDAPLTFAGTTNALAVAIYGPMPLAKVAGGLIQVTGDLDKGQSFVDLFALRP